MAYEIGTATDYKDLLNKLKVFVSTNAALVAAGQQWTVLRHMTPADGAHELIVRGPGLAGADQIYVGIQTESPSNGGRNWVLNGFTGYDAPSSFSGQPGGVPTSQPRLLLLDSGMPYWFFASGRRIVVVARASTSYQIAYLGFILPYGPPAGLAYPMFVGGCACSASVWSDIDGRSNSPFYAPRHTSYGVRPTESSGYFFSAGWKNVIDMYYSNTNFIADRELFVLPFCCMRDPAGYKSLLGLRPNLDGSYPLLAATLCSTVPSRNVFGEFEGLFGVPGIGIAGEDTIEYNGVSYIVFPGGGLSGRNHFVAVRMD